MLKDHTTDELIEELVRRGARMYTCKAYSRWDVQIKRKYSRDREPFTLPASYKFLAIDEEGR